MGTQHIISPTYRRKGHTTLFYDPTMDVCLHLRGENLKSKDLMSKSDPYFEVFYPKDCEDPIYKSEIIKNVIDACWEPANFSLPKSALMRNVRIRLMDKDTFTSDDLILDCEIRYPFRQKNYAFGACASDDGTEARLCVLNNDGESDSEDDSKGKPFGSGTKDKVFKVLKLGKQFK